MYSISELFSFSKCCSLKKFIKWKFLCHIYPEHRIYKKKDQAKFAECEHVVMILRFDRPTRAQYWGKYGTKISLSLLIDL